MNDSKRTLENLKNEKNKLKHQHSKSSKNRSNSRSKRNNKDNKTRGLMLSRIEERIEIGNGQKELKNRLLDTCVLKDIKKLLIAKEDDKDKDNMMGYNIDNINKTIIKFNKTPKQLEIEKFIFPEKVSKSKEIEKIFNFNNDSFENTNLNDRSENKGNINFIKKFKDNYQSEPEENKKRKKKVKSNIIFNSKKLKKELKGKKFKNTVLIKNSDFNTILKITSKEIGRNKGINKDIYNNQIQKQKAKKEDNKKYKEREDNSQKEKVIIKDENKKIKEKDNYKEEENNSIYLTPIRRKNKSKTKKQVKITFQLNKEKNINKKNTQNFLSSNNNIEKIEFTKKPSNNDNSNKNEENANKMKNKIKNDINRRQSLKSCHLENDNLPKSSKQKRSKKRKILFKSVLFTKNKIFEQKKKQLSLNKNNTLKNLKQKKDKDNSDSSFSIEKKNLKDILSSNSEKKIKIKDKIKKAKYNNNIKIYKEDSNNNDNNDINSSSKNSSILNKGITGKIKDNKNYKKNINNIINNNSKYIIKHENEIFFENNQNKKEKLVIKIHEFSIIQPDKLIYLEYNRAYERPNSINNKLNKLNKKSEETLNDINIRNKNENNENNFNEESMENKIKIRNKSVFCCL